MSVADAPSYLSKEQISRHFDVEITGPEDRQDIWGLIKAVLDERRQSELPDSCAPLVATLEAQDVVTDLNNAYKETVVIAEKIVSTDGRRYTHAKQENKRVNHIGMIVGGHRQATSLKTQDGPDNRARINPEPKKSQFETERHINVDRIENNVTNQPEFIVWEEDGIEIVFPNTKVETIQDGEIQFKRDYADPVTRQDLAEEMSSELPDLSEMTVEYQGQLEDATVLHHG